MSLDLKYRPLRYSDVIGQDATVQVCKEYVRKGRGFQQSYVFAGAHGGGKTTCGRILARALLCEDPQEGEPCDKCSSCVAMLENKSENFIEVDAATNSGKEDIKRITEEARYGSFSGKRKIYLFDECHELSRQAMDAMLKPLEDNIRGTEDRQLVCIFCTTEPEKMRSAILSRCAPLFRIRSNTPDEIGQRLAYICDQEGIEYDPEVLPLIAEVCETHVRDSIKAVEGVSMLGRVDRDNVVAYLHMDANALYLELLEKIGTDLPGVMKVLSELNERVAPATRYERMADVCMLAYRVSVFGQATVPAYWDRDRLKKVGDLHREFLVQFAQCFAERPARASSSMFECDVSALHQKRAGIVVVASPTTVSVPATAALQPEASTATAPPPTPPATTGGTPVATSAPKTFQEFTGMASPSSEPAPATPVAAKETKSESAGIVDSTPYVSPMGIGINPIAQNSRGGNRPHQSTGHLPGLRPSEFSSILQRRVIELTEEQSSSGRSARFNDMGGS